MDKQAPLYERSYLKLKPAALLLSILWLLQLGCAKEYSCENCQGTPPGQPPPPGVNQPPVAKAGTDLAIVLPRDSALLNGSASSDPDGSIVSYKWTKLGGAVATIRTPTAAQTMVSQLIQGNYTFELLVTDNGGLTSRDTVNISVGMTVVFNQPPVADAGQDMELQYNLATCTFSGSGGAGNAVILDGSSSYDPDGTVVSFRWDCISSSQATISDAQSGVTTASGLVAGVYQFRLTVTDNSGADNEAVVNVTVVNVGRPVINATTQGIGNLSRSRFGMSVVFSGSKLFYAGGAFPSNTIPNGQSSSRVDIYDVVSQAWSTAELSQARYYTAAAALNGKVFFAGGFPSPSQASSRIDIYDQASNTWSTAELSQARGSIATAVVGNKIYFAGGDQNPVPSLNIDVYDGATGTWSIMQLTQPKANMAAVVSGNKIYFAGGYYDGLFQTPSNKVDVFDVVSKSMTGETLVEPKKALLGISVGNKIYYAGGFTSGQGNGFFVSNVVEVKDLTTSSSTTTCLFQPNAWYNSTPLLKNNKLVFFTGEPGNSVTNMFDILDLTTNSWQIGQLPFSMKEASVIAVNNVIYIAGGYLDGSLSTAVMKLEW